MSAKALRPIAILLLLGTAFGYLEAAVVSYLRMLHEPARRHFYPNRQSCELFPPDTGTGWGGRPATNPFNRDRARGCHHGDAGGDCSGRCRDARQWAAAFATAFGVWDIVFYAGLKLLLGWPASLFTLDILFLIPVPWVGPVIAPVLVSIAMITGGIWCLCREAAGTPLRIGRWNITGVLLGALVIVLSFTLDYRNIMAGGMPHPFHWGVFGLGLGIGAVSYGRTV